VVAVVAREVLTAKTNMPLAVMAAVDTLGAMV
jgi:hypothetical protein